MEVSRRGLRWGVALLPLLLLAGCECGKGNGGAVAAATPSTTPQLNAVLWEQKAPEYRAATRTVYGHARMRLDQALADPSWSALVSQNDDRLTTLPSASAIILDIDETVLDNSPLYARQAKDPALDMGKEWSKWTAEAKAKALAGAVEFIRYAVERGVTVFLVSNRTCDQDEATRKNLTAVGFPVDGIHLVSRNTGYADPDQVITCPAMESLVKRLFDIDHPRWYLAKSYRRAAIGGRYRVLLQFGDSQGDFYSPLPGPDDTPERRERLLQAHLSREERDRIDSAYADYYTDRWMALPNAMYGNWWSSNVGYQRGGMEKQTAEALKVISTE